MSQEKMKLELYFRPRESPMGTIEDKDLRIYYNNQWVDFRDGEIRITKDVCSQPEIPGIKQLKQKDRKEEEK